MKEYRDPFHKRSMSFGEIGCFLSHYRIWEDTVNNGYKRILVFEDDLRFVQDFKRKLQRVMEEADSFVPDWDLIYLGRKRMADSDGPMVQNCHSLGHVNYSYWTLAYALSYSGASKLLGAQPFRSLLPVDEFLPIMFDKHPNSTWKSYFTNRKLKAFTAEPLLVFPTHYTGELGYISDTDTGNDISSSTMLNVADELTDLTNSTVDATVRSEL